MSQPALQHAKFVRQSGPGKGKEVEVQFNPASLHYELVNTLDNKGNSDSTKQAVSQSSGKLTLDLVFDTTHDGQDVRQQTEKIASFAAPRKVNPPPKDKKPAVKVIPVITFEWGVYKFQGVVESFKETLDFFSPDGVPLRSTVNLTLASQDRVFQPGAQDKERKTQLRDEGLDIPAPGSSGAADVAKKAGDARAARDLGAANGEDSLRFSDSDSLVVDDSISLGPPVAFATGGIGGGISAGIGGGISGGFGIGVSGGIGIGGGVSGGFGASGGFGVGISGGVSGGFSAGIGVGAGFAAGGSGGVSIQTSVGSVRSVGGVSFGGAVSVSVVTFGSRASARVTASEGAFAGLRPPSLQRRRRPQLRVEDLLEAPGSTALGSDDGAGFAVGGRASVEGPLSLRSEVVSGSADLSLRGRIQFDEE